MGSGYEWRVEMKWDDGDRTAVVFVSALTAQSAFFLAMEPSELGTLILRYGWRDAVLTIELA